MSAWRDLADGYGASVSVIECICSDLDVHRARVEGRSRDIPGWYELVWEHVAAGRERYVPIEGLKLVLDAMHPFEHNLALARRHLGLTGITT